MAAVNPGRGRGFATPAGQLRRPGVPAATSASSVTSTPSVSSVADTFSNVLTIPKATITFDDICDRIVQMNLVANPEQSESCIDDIEKLCSTEEDLKNFAETLLQCALMSKANAHTVAIFVQNHKDIRVIGSNERLLTAVLRKLQVLFEGRIGPSRVSNGQEAFHLEVIFMCEIFYHVRINDSFVKVLQPAVYDYFCMLLDGGTPKDIDVFVEQFPKCFPDLKDICMERLLCKVRKNIVVQMSYENRAKLLEMLELIVTDFKPLKENALDFYHSINIPVVRICSDSSAYSKS